MTARDTRTFERRVRRGLVIEATATDLSAGPARRQAHAEQAPQSSILDLAERLSARPYQSLLDDAMRLARGCRPLSAAVRALSPSS